MAWHPALLFTTEALVAAGTLSLAFGTFLLARRTSGMADAERRSLRLAVRPFLADPSPTKFTDVHEQLQFGAPGRISVEVRRGDFWHEMSGPSGGHFSVAFENVGSGVAAVVSARVEPPLRGDVYVSRRFVPTGEIIRVNVSVLDLPAEGKSPLGQWWAMEGVDVLIEYSDTIGEARLLSRASIRQYATQGPFVQEITVSDLVEDKVLAVGRGSY
jgi:hypothetical protein